jgi:hypothetical protein
MTTDTPESKNGIFRSRWFVPVFSVAMGAVMLAAMWIGGHPRDGLGALGLMTGLGLVFLLGGRSETIRGLRGDGRDERFALIDLKATAFAGLAIIVAVIAGFLIEIARGHSGAPFDWLGAIGGFSYALAILILRWRS